MPCLILLLFPFFILFYSPSLLSLFLSLFLCYYISLSFLLFGVFLPLALSLPFALCPLPFALACAFVFVLAFGLCLSPVPIAFAVCLCLLAFASLPLPLPLVFCLTLLPHPSSTPHSVPLKRKSAKPLPFICKNGYICLACFVFICIVLSCPICLGMSCIALSCFVFFSCLVLLWLSIALFCFVFSPYRNLILNYSFSLTSFNAPPPLLLKRKSAKPSPFFQGRSGSALPCLLLFCLVLSWHVLSCFSVCPFRIWV
jgi:hypothetical protein